MAKTFNRRPLQVNTPSSNDVKNYFFNHCNWKGINKDKNFLTIDQETFADAKNVYIDAEGLLKSRPSVKRKTMFFDSAIDFWNFDDTDIYLRKEDNNGHVVYNLCFVIDAVEYNKSVTNENVKVIRIQNLIYCFTDNDFFYFNTENREFGDGFEKVYVPSTTFDVSGIKTETEDKNILTDRERYTYFYNSEYGISTEAQGKELNVSIDGKDYSFVFEPSSLELLTNILFKMPDGYEYVDVSKNDTYLFYSSSLRAITYSATGKTLSKTFLIPEEYGQVTAYPKFTQDSSFIVVGTEKSIYIVSVIAEQSDGQLRFPVFTDVKTYMPDFVWGVDYSGAFLVSAGYNFVTYDEFICFENIYDSVDDSYSSSFSYVNTDGVKLGMLGLSNINDVVFNKNYKLVGSDNGELVVDGLIALYGSGGGVNRLFLVNLNGDENGFYTDAYEYIKEDSSSMGGIKDLKIVNNEILFIENKTDGRHLSKLAGIPYKEEIQDSFTLTSTVYTPNLELYNQMDLISDDGSKIYFDGGIYFVNESKRREIIAKDTVYLPIFYGRNLYYLDSKNNVFSNRIVDNIHFEYTKNGENHYFNPSLISNLNNYYLVNDKTLYISDYREEDGEFRWYLPEINKQTFDSTITNLYPISSTEMGIFFEDAIWYGYLSEQGYRYTKSKVELGVKFGSDILASYDGTRLIFPTERGIVALSYQDFVASTDQILTFLSDAIHLEIKDFCKQPVLLFKRDYWIFVYRKNSNELYVLDSRNNSWWFWSLSNKIKKFVKYDDEMLILSDDGTFHKFSESNENYFDYDGKKHTIDWYVTSQKLHLSQINNYKHLVNITLNSVIDTETYFTFFLDVTNYRKTIDGGKTENISYTIERLRTYIQRLNYFKVNEFQYTLRSDNENKHPLPLSLSSIGIKYKIQGQVR